MNLQSLVNTVFSAWVLSVVVSAQDEPNCPHGLSANDIASKSGLDLTGKTALVTGGRSGLGFAISEALVRQNCTVIIASRDELANQEAVDQLQTIVPGAEVSYLIFDLEDFDSVRSFAASVASSSSKLDYYFANAGRGFGSQPLTVDSYDRIFQTNYVAQFLLLELLLPLLRNTETGRILLTGSSSHSLACGNLFLSNWPQQEDACFADNKAMDMLPFDEAGLAAVNDTFGCPPLASTYPLTKYLFVQLAREITERESESGNQVYAYSWAPGNIKTDLNPFASCCSGPTESFGPTCRYQLPYVGPKDDEGNPDRPDPPVPNHWSSPAHGAMSAIYTALHADTADAGKFFATYWECEADKGYFHQGMTPEGRDELYELSKEWAGISEVAVADEAEMETDMGAEITEEEDGEGITDVDDEITEEEDETGNETLLTSTISAGNRLESWSVILSIGIRLFL